MIFDSSKDRETAFEIAADFFNYSAIEVTALVGRGSVNKVFVVEAENAKVVVRFRNDAAAFDEYKKEAWCIERAAIKGVPVPAVLSVGLSENNVIAASGVRQTAVGD